MAFLDNQQNIMTIPHSIELKAIADAQYQFLKTGFLRQYIANFMEDGTLPFKMETIEGIKLMEQAADRMSTKPPYILLTINPREEIELLEFKKKVEKFADRKIVSRYAYVFEVRKKDKGLHCHMLVQYDCKPYDFKRAARSTFKNVCEVNNPCILNIKYVSLDQLDSKMNYLKGEKSDKKNKSVKYTRRYRRKHELEAMYQSNPKLAIVPCGVTKQIEGKIVTDTVD